MTKRRPARANGGKTNNREKIGKTPHDPARPIGKSNPPIETQFQPGKTGNPHGRPRKLEELQELIYEILEENLIAPNGKIVGTRAQMMVRVGLNKNPVPFLEYAFGKVPQHLTVEDVTLKPDSELVAELQSILDSAAAATRAGDSGGTPAAGAGGDSSADSI